jgi:hypothetical protein
MTDTSGSSVVEDPAGDEVGLNAHFGAESQAA